MIRTAKIIKDDTMPDEVGIGKIVTLRFLSDDETEKFTIVTTIEADPMNNMISIESPIGKAIYRHKIGETVMVESPQGQYEVKIEDVCKKE